MANNTVYDNSLVPEGFTNWNAYLNSFAKELRGAIKCNEIAAPERQAVDTLGYRIDNIYTGSVSPTVGRPWADTA
jgi:hypothetical protein